MNNWDRRKFSDIKSGPYVKRESRMKPVIKKVQFEYFWKKIWENEKILRIFEKNGILLLLHRMLSVTFHSQDFQIHRKIFSHWCKLFFSLHQKSFFSIVIFFNRKSRGYSRFFKGARYRFTRTAGISFKLSYPEPCQEDSKVKGFGVWVHL